MDNRIEQQQVRVKLTSDPEVLAQLLRNRRIIQLKNGKYQYTATFDSMPVTITTGTTIQLGRAVARALIADSYVILGDHLTGEQKSALIESGTFSLGDATPENVCDYCQHEFEGEDVKVQKAVHLATCPELLKLQKSSAAPPVAHQSQQSNARTVAGTATNRPGAPKASAAAQAAMDAIEGTASTASTGKDNDAA